MNKPTIFISYSHKDEKEKDELLAHLGVLQFEGLVELWNDHRIGAGAEWQKEINDLRRGNALRSSSWATAQSAVSRLSPAAQDMRERKG